MPAGDDVRFREEIENSRVDIEKLLLQVQAMVLKGNARVLPAERARLQSFMKDFSAATIAEAIAAKKFVAVDLCLSRSIRDAHYGRFIKTGAFKDGG
jgi:hypothetical protein